MALCYRISSIGRSLTPRNENCQRLPGYRKKGRIRISRASANLTLEGLHFSKDKERALVVDGC